MKIGDISSFGSEKCLGNVHACSLIYYANRNKLKDRPFVAVDCGAIYEFSETEENQMFFVMAYYDGALSKIGCNVSH